MQIQITRNCFLIVLFISGLNVHSQTLEVKTSKFAQLAQELPTPNRYRSASGNAGPDYWQQRADYVIDVTLDDEKQSIAGKETITYYNQSPDELRYLWLQLDQNSF